MNKLKAWVNAARLRTLPLALSGIILGSAFAYSNNGFSSGIFALAVITTLLLQILSNFANDYGDFTHGTDNKNRVGPERTVQSGAIAPKQMKLAIIITSLFAFISGLCMLYIAFKGAINIKFLGFMFLGFASIAAAIKYTVGKSNYGYIGLGDIMVFLFFGLTAVIGSYFLHMHAFHWTILVPAFAIGFLSTGVLNLNNMRDAENDKASKKNTMAVILGTHKSKSYHSMLIIGAVLISLLFAFWTQNMLLLFLLLIPSANLVKHLQSVFYNTTPKSLDPELKRLSLTTLLFAIMFSLGIIL